MNLHQYQAKELFAKYTIPVPKGEVADSPDSSVAAARALGRSLWVVKARNHASGRGEAGGVKLVKDLGFIHKKGGHPVRGMIFIDVLGLFENDGQTEAIVVAGEIGGSDEEAAAAFMRGQVSTPVAAYIARRLQ